MTIISNCTKHYNDLQAHLHTNICKHIYKYKFIKNATLIEAWVGQTVYDIRASWNNVTLLTDIL